MTKTDRNFAYKQLQRWVCIQNLGGGRQWINETTIEYTRTQSIKSLIGDSSLKWRELKDKYGWRCSKVFIDINEF